MWKSAQTRTRPPSDARDRVERAQTATHPELKHNLKFGTAKNRVDRKIIINPLVAFQRRDDRRRVRQARRLEHDGGELLPLFYQTS